MNIELHLARPNSQSAQVTVTCNGTLSHTFDLQTLIPNNTNGLPHPLHDPVTYGKTLYTALFPQDSPAFQALSTKPSRILLVATDDVLDTIPWEYAYGPNGYLACSCSFVRGLPLDQRIAPPTNLNELHIIAVASSPLSHVLAPLNIQGEWTRLTEIVSKQKRTISLERAWPPTIEYLRELVAGQEQLVVHFMGHGGQNGEAVLCFERDDGTREDISASEFVQRLQGSVFLVTLNACQSATPGKTVFSNLAKALIHEQIPYALGMRFSIHDDDARDFSRTFYNDLARGVSVEKALVQARLTLAKSERVWAAGNLVLYTSLTQPAPGYTTARGDPDVRDEQKDALRGIIHELTGVQGAFQGRIDEQIKLGKWLTGDSRPRIIAIHANGGQGKTALARVAAERFAHAWPGGVWAISMETVPTLAVFTASLARFLGINPQENTDQIELEKQILLRLHRQRTLLVLDNLETLDEATKAKDAGAITLIEFIQKLPNERTTILYTSRHLLGLSGEQHLELPGLAPDEGAALFKQSAPNHVKKIDDALARQLSQRVDGHPLGLSLLGKAFNSSSISFQNFLADHEKYLHSAENRFIDVEHRQHKMFANVDYSVRWLSNELRDTFSKLWIFHAPFFPEDAVSILDPEQDETSKASPIEDHLYTLWQRGLLTREPLSESNDSEYVYRLPPVIHPFVEKYMADQSKREELLKRFGEVYAGLAKYIYGQLVQGRAIIGLALLCYDDLTRGWQFVEGIERSRYLLYWGWILHRLSDQRRAIALTEQALELAEGQDRALEGSVLHNLAGISHAIGRTHKALRLYEQALAIRREVGDRSGEGTTLNNLGRVYDDLGQKPQALDYYQQALAIRREVGDRSGEGTTLNNLGRVYNALGQKPQALAYYQQALAIWREVGDRSGEGITLHNIGMIYAGFGQLDVVLACALLAKALFEYVQSPYIEYAKQLINSLRRHLGEERFAALLAQVAPRANEIVERALQEKRLPDEVEQFPSTLPPEQINIIISNTITVMTTMPERRAEWQETISRVLQVAQQRGSDWQIEVEFYTAILAILDGQSLSLPTDHPYASALAAIQEGIANGGQPPDEAEDIPEEVQALIAFVEACVAALRSPDPQEKMAFMQQLATSQAQAEDDEMKILLQKLQLALFGGDLMKLGENLTGFARQVWDMIVAGVQQDDTSSDEEPDTP